MGSAGKRTLARAVGRAADVLVRKRAFTQAERDRIVILLRACEQELLDEAADQDVATLTGS